MPVSATSIVAKPQQYLANLVAASATFRTVVGAANATEALKSIHWPEASDRLDDDGRMEHPRPRAIIQAGPDHALQRKGPGHWWDRGCLLLTFEFLIPPPQRTNIKDALFWFENQYGAILDEMMDAVDLQNGTYLHAHTFELESGPDYPDPDTDPDGDAVYGVSYLAHW